MHHHAQFDIDEEEDPSSNSALLVDQYIVRDTPIRPPLRWAWSTSLVVILLCVSITIVWLGTYHWHGPVVSQTAWQHPSVKQQVVGTIPNPLPIQPIVGQSPPIAGTSPGLIQTNAQQPATPPVALTQPVIGQTPSIVTTSLGPVWQHVSCPPGKVPDGTGGCSIPSDSKTTGPWVKETMTFYMYRAQSQENYELENVNTASLAGLMWYLEKEVVRGVCPRKYNITRILRLLVTVRPPPELPHRFANFVAFDKGKCTAPICGQIFSKYGFVVGCQKQTGVPYEPNPVWYSLPGACPLVDFKSKDAACKAAQPGGKCNLPNGAKDCTWNLKPAGEISIAELEGIPDYDSFCANGGNEYQVSFWDGRGGKPFNEARVRSAMNLFRSKFPGMPDLPDPECEWG